NGRFAHVASAIQGECSNTGPITRTNPSDEKEFSSDKVLISPTTDYTDFTDASFLKSVLSVLSVVTIISESTRWFSPPTYRTPSHKVQGVPPLCPQFYCG